MTEVRVRPYVTAGGCTGREVVEVDTDSGSTRTVLVDYQANGRDLYEVARSHAILHGLVVAS